MNDSAPPPVSTSARPARDGVTYAIWGATVLILLAVGSAGYVLRQEMLRLQEQKPKAPPEVTRALSDLRSSLVEQRAENATQIDALKQQVEALQQSQGAPGADLDAVKEKLDALAAQLAEQKAAAEATALPADPMAKEKETAPASSTALEDYLALYQAVRSGKPYAKELALLVPQLNDLDPDALSDLQEHAQSGVATEEALMEEWQRIATGSHDDAQDESDSSLPGWMQAINRRFGGLVKIRRTHETGDDDAQEIRSLEDMAAMVNSLPDDATKPYADWLDKMDARRDVYDALQIVETSLSRGA